MSAIRALSSDPAAWVMALDVGGTKLAAAAVTADGLLTRYRTTATNASEGGPVVLSRLIELAHSLIADARGRPAAIGIATHGIVDPLTGTIRFASDNLPGWTGVRLGDVIGSEFPDLPIRMANDGHAAVWAEHQLGCGQGVAEFAMLILGTGVGGGVISQGHLLYGANGAHGRIGHLSIDPRGESCSCGNRGCLEMYVSGTAIGKSYQQAMTGNAGGEAAPSAQDAVLAANQGDPIAINVLTMAGMKLGHALVQIMRVFDPTVIAIGGGMASAGEWLLRPARDHLNLSTPPELSPPQVRLAQLGANASLIGAGILGWQAIGRFITLQQDLPGG